MVVETVLSRDEVVFPAPPDKVARSFEASQKVAMAAFRMQGVGHNPVAMHVWITTAHERTATGNADRILAVGVAEADRFAVLHQRVQSRGGSGGIAEVAEAVGPLGISDEKKEDEGIS
jgi:hypothetical protein